MLNLKFAQFEGNLLAITFVFRNKGEVPVLGIPFTSPTGCAGTRIIRTGFFFQNHAVFVPPSVAIPRSEVNFDSN